MTNSCAYLLVVHGSKNSNYQKSVNTLANLVKNNLQNQNLLCELDISYLELSQQSLSSKIIDFAKYCSNKNYKNIKILPLFLLAGTHVKQDIPTEFNEAKNIIQEQKININIELIEHLGSHQSFLNFLIEKYQHSRKDNLIIIAHGTTLPNGNQEIENLAKYLKAELAFWSINPTIEEKITFLIDSNYKNINILPYFLFRGKITELIALKIDDLSTKYPQIKLTLFEPIGITEQLTNIITKILI